MAKNMYLHYRFRASKDNKALHNRADAAEILGISESSLSNYETGKTKCVPPEMVAQMSKLYKAPELRNQYCVYTCPIGSNSHLATQEATIEQVIIHLLTHLDTNMIQSQINELLQITQKEMTEHDIRVLESIARKFAHIIFAVTEFNIYAERNGVWIM